MNLRGKELLVIKSAFPLRLMAWSVLYIEVILIKIYNIVITEAIG